MKQIKLNPLTASKFFENLQPKVATVNNFKQPKTGLSHINRGEAFNGVVPGKITQKVDPSIGRINKTISPTASNIPEVTNIPKTEAFNGLVPGKFIPEIKNSKVTTPDKALSKTMKNILIAFGVVVGIRIVYLLFKKEKPEKEKS